ncbi:MAG: glycosyltransferase family 4 protein [Anaerolineales bacterium]|nr:glycosyltransferase family 4 protein [Anaerolineales bacterium]
MSQLILFILLSVLSYFLVALIRRYAERRQIIDHPNERSSHVTPTPRGGGLAIVVLTVGSAVWAMRTVQLSHAWVYLVCGVVIAILGWRDDLHSLSARVRFAVQGIVAAVSIYGLGYFKVVTIPLFGELHLGAVGIVITFLWIVGLINAYNFMDGIDGIAGGVALAGAFGWMALASNTRNDFVFSLALVVAASSLGFLGHNWSPAKIFMGDVASTFLGYTFAVLPLLSATQGGDALLIGTLLMWTFIMDAGVTFIRRALNRENVFESHRTHLYQRLVIGGYPHHIISTLYLMLTLLAGALAYEWSQGSRLAPPLIIIGLPLIWILLSRHAKSLTAKNAKVAKV